MQSSMGHQNTSRFRKTKISEMEASHYIADMVIELTKIADAANLSNVASLLKLTSLALDGEQEKN